MADYGTKVFLFLTIFKFLIHTVDSINITPDECHKHIIACMSRNVTHYCGLPSYS